MRWPLLLCLALLPGVVLARGSVPPPQAQPGCPCGPVETLPPIQIPDVERYVPPELAPAPGEPPKKADYRLLQAADWGELEGWNEDDLGAAWGAWLQSCKPLARREPWRAACEASARLTRPSGAAIRALLQEHFTPYRLHNEDGSDSGLVTGYYQPILDGSRSRSERYRYPLYQRPHDMVSVELGAAQPDLVHRRLRGRLLDGMLVPYYSRGEIEVRQSPLAGRELLWVDDIIDLFFLHIQGSGLVRLDNGETVHVGYADHNGHRYESIGRVLIQQGELTADQASMQGIKGWARGNLARLRDLLNANPSYVFFRELPPGLPGPLGALGVPLTAGRSIAIDPRFVPLGAPVFLSTTRPNGGEPLRRLMLAQDAGGAIKGGVRADFYWGAGFEAGQQAGAMKQQGRMWVLLPKGMLAPDGVPRRPPPAALHRAACPSGNMAARITKPSGPQAWCRGPRA